MILLIDIGNTRIKWAMLSDAGLSPMSAAVYSEGDGAKLATQVFTSDPKPERILVSNVGGERMAATVTQTAIERWGVRPEFVHSTTSACGVRTGYVIPEQLGVDRWLAMIAARDGRNTAVCVASIGTAATVDGLDRQGVHLGGVIVPGPNLAKQSLLKSTSDLALRSQTGTPAKNALFADNTLGAIDQGIAHMVAALIERFHADMHSRLGEKPALLLTGGASDRITPALRVPFETVPDLVLRGLAAVARNRSDV